MSDPRTASSDPTRPIRLGPFVLQEPIGRGGMGAVWRGWHHERGVPVAVKVLDTQVEDLGRTFKNEVEAVARLDHPGVVWVYDVGEVDRAAAEASRGRLAAGNPYIAMEYASRGTLRDWGKLPWESVREVLLALLDALAHAHARGVIHRDLKPANVLVCGPEDLRPGLKLADFGIAHAVEHTQGLTHGHKTAIGTVQYMAPEQIRAEQWDTGAWTDIYALGNVAWQLLTGRIPFSHHSGVALVRAQLDEPLPDPKGERVPDGFVDWLRRCVAKDPTDRFQRCADAAEALLELGGAEDKGAGEVVDRLPTIRVELADDGTVTSPIDRTDALGREVSEALELHTGLVSLTMAPSAKRRSGAAASGPVQRVPSDWRRPEVARRSFQLLGAGLALYGVRRPPMVGRIAERDALWTALRDVARDGQPRVAVILGPAGTGKSRLARWLTERAHELGAATPLKTRFFVEDAEDAPLRRMWARHLRMAEVEPSGRGRWLLKVLDRLGLHGEPENFAVLVGPGDHGVRRRQSEVTIRAMTRERPVIVSLDDVDVGLEGLRLAEHLMDAERPLPVLIVITARTETLVDRADERLRVERLAARGLELPLGPLPVRDHAVLIEEVLGLSPALAAQVAERTGGNPRFAIQLIGDWVQRGVLTLGATGFEVRPGEVAELPASLRDVWVDRVQRLLHGLPEKAHALLERAAVLGLDVEHQEWQRATDDPDGSWAAAGRQRVVPENERLRGELLQRLIATHLARATPTGFSFGHGMVREAVLDRARAAGRLVEHHVACAATLRFNDDVEAAAERIGRHLLDAGGLEEAIEPLLQGVVHRRDTAGARSALGLLATAEEALGRLRPAEADPRWGEAWQLRSMLLAELGEVAEARRVAEKVITAGGPRPTWLPHVLDARLVLARLEAAEGDLDAADHTFQEILERSGDPVQQGLAHAERALIAARRGEREQARAQTDAAVRLLRRAASSRALAECWRVVGTTALLLGNERQADDALSRGLRLYRLRGNIVGQADCLSGLGRSAVRRGDRELAEDRLKQAIHLYEVAGQGDVVRPRADLARLRIEEGRFEQARDLLGHVRLALGRQGRAGGVEGLGALQLAAAAGAADWEEVDHRLRQIEGNPASELGEYGRWAMELAARLAEGAGKNERARRVKGVLESVPRTTGRARA